MSDFLIIDCGIGNLRSVQKVVERLGVSAPISGDPSAVEGADAVILPGVGAFGDAMADLRRTGMDAALRGHTVERGKPLLGICLGMQLLACGSDEAGNHEGLGLIEADVLEMKVAGKRDWAGRKLTLPHIGWNAVQPAAGSVLFRDVPADSDFYFVHGYHVICDDPALIAATCDYGGPVVCGIERNNIFGAQFHPEKSQANGQRLLRNFVEHCADLAAAA